MSIKEETFSSRCAWLGTLQQIHRFPRKQIHRLHRLLFR